MKTIRQSTAVRLAAATALVTTVLPWQAALAIPALSAGVQTCHFDPYGQTACTSDGGSVSSGTVTYQLSEPGQHAFASQGFGVFKGSASMSLAPNTVLVRNPISIQSAATGTMVDNWVIRGGTGYGALRFTWAVDGTASSFSTSTTNPGRTGMDDDASITISADVDAQTFGTASTGGYATSGPIRSAGTYQLSTTEQTGEPILFVFDRPLEVTFSSTVVAGLATGANFTGPNFSGEAQADFSHTAVLTGVQAYDLRGNLLPNITITAESGTLYPLTPVPEPASAALMLCGLGALAWRQRGRLVTPTRR